MITLLPLQEFISLTSVQGKLCASTSCYIFCIDSLHVACILHQVLPKLLRSSICIELMVALAHHFTGQPSVESDFHIDSKYAFRKFQCSMTTNFGCLGMATDTSSSAYKPPCMSTEFFEIFHDRGRRKQRVDFSPRLRREISSPCMGFSGRRHFFYPRGRRNISPRGETELGGGQRSGGRRSVRVRGATLGSGCEGDQPGEPGGGGGSGVGPHVPHATDSKRIRGKQRRRAREAATVGKRAERRRRGAQRGIEEREAAVDFVKEHYNARWGLEGHPMSTLFYSFHCFISISLRRFPIGALVRTLCCGPNGSQ
ncbi:hypothetical protein GW17_00021544 [Ensete ventricosum]|nr:hypothetical protein GW17_00021544 [Ensete ventricosum]RZS11195.1 hypothetical protein BHM03_00042512 [Ensete ventricosum]